MELRHRDEDREIEELFESARRDESEQTPEFAALMRNLGSRRRWPPPRRAFGIAALTAAASVLVAFAATWLAVREDVIEPFGTGATAPETGQPPTVVAQDVEKRANGPVPPLKGQDVEGLRSLGYLAPGDEAAVPAPPPPARPQPQLPPDVDAGVPAGTPVGSPQMEPVTVVAQSETIDPTTDATARSTTFIADLPEPGRNHQGAMTLAPGVQDGGPDTHGSRARDFQAVVAGAVNVDALQGQLTREVNPNTIEQAETITPGAQVAFGRAQGGFARTGHVGGVAGGVLVAAAEERLEESPGFNTESYQPIVENEFLSVTENPLSTFSVDVDTASYANVRRFLTTGRLPPPDAVRIEELINYFRYDYPEPAPGAPFSATIEIAECPWNADHRLARIGLQGRALTRGEHNGSNLVFLIDVSGSMAASNKLPLLKQALGLLADQLDGRDQVAIVVYAGASGLVLPPTAGDDHAAIKGALQRLGAGGSTNGGAGLQLAYRLARENFVQGGNNRVILATDGDFNVGVTSPGEMLQIIEDDARGGIFLTVLGVGTGNYKDAEMEHLADRGNGNYAYLDDLQEARKVLVEELTGTLFTIAKDVKIQIEFNPAEVGAYRLIGYENRLLKQEDFNDDRKDAGEIGAGHTVTALYELVPPDEVDPALPAVDELKYQVRPAPAESAASGEAFTLKLRYKEPDGDTSKLLSFAVRDEGTRLDAASPDFKFAAAVAAFGMALRDSTHRGALDLDGVRELALDGAGADASGRRSEFVGLIGAARALVPAGDR